MSDVVLSYIERDNKYLMLLRNKRDIDINKNKFIGIGGHIEKGETKEEALVREIWEETGLIVKHFTYRGYVYFNNGNPKDEENMYLFHVDEFEGEIKECDEGTLYWIDKDKVLDLNLWEGDKYFLIPFMNSNDLINLRMYYKDDKLIKYEKI